VILRAGLAWFAILALAIVNGALRELWIIPHRGELVGHVASTLLLCAVIVLTSWFAIGWIRPLSSQQAWTVGLEWVLMTLAFEFLAGHYLFGNPWSRLFADYNVLRGRIWVLVLITTLLAPVYVASVRGLVK
jgi:hypothetical protein